MGTRIHKVLGWGFKYYRVGTDPRFSDSFFDQEGDYLPQMIALAKQDAASDDFIKSYSAKFFLHEVEQAKLERVASYDVFKINGYASDGEISPCVFTDPMRKDWSRYDDIIDYYESGSVPTDEVKFILDSQNQPAQIYPYCAFVDRRTGQRLNNIQSERWWVTELYFENKRKKKKNLDWSAIQERWPGITNIIEWQRDVVPDVPYTIDLFCRVAKPFKNPLTIYRLKPMIYTYWC